MRIHSIALNTSKYIAIYARLYTQKLQPMHFVNDHIGVPEFNIRQRNRLFCCRLCFVFSSLLPIPLPSYGQAEWPLHWPSSLAKSLSVESVYDGNDLAMSGC